MHESTKTNAEDVLELTLKSKRPSTTWEGTMVYLTKQTANQNVRTTQKALDQTDACYFE